MRAAEVVDLAGQTTAHGLCAPAGCLAELSHVHTAGAILAERRRHGVSGPRLSDALRPATLWHALAIQSAVIEHMGEAVVGWKCGTPGPDKLVVAPLFAGSLHQASPCPVWATASQGGDQVKIEPELAFVIGRDLPPRDEPYRPEEVDLAIAGTHVALELIDSRYDSGEDLSFADKLADGLVNQGLFLGPRVDDDTARLARAMPIEVRADGQAWQAFDGQHPDGEPRLPLYWLADYLRGHGQGLRAGQVVITGSYAGSFMVPVGAALSVRFGALGELAVRFAARARLSSSEGSSAR
jgi:2-keto-4-pentenoate hydratase